LIRDRCNEVVREVLLAVIYSAILINVSRGAKSTASTMIRANIVLSTPRSWTDAPFYSHLRLDGEKGELRIPKSQDEALPIRHAREGSMDYKSDAPR
jgi:hypothetical protein